MKTQTPALMLQATASNAGKSLFTAALCRILTQDGYQVAPFKAQNMALNSCVVGDGLEMGRAQAVQAQACRRALDVRMNPVLLKPNSDQGSQVIVMGRSQGVMSVREYFAFKPQAFKIVCEAYESLAAQVDVMVLEGAGSPAEINLKQHDIVNMAMAAKAKAKVLLLGDIDRGGVFAALAGTMLLLDDWERELIIGMIINKFRGDASLLPSALEQVGKMCQKPFLGVVPFIHQLNLPDEDSVSFKLAQPHQPQSFNGQAYQGELDIVIIDLPRISNFTDFDALKLEPDVNLRIVRSVQELGQPDVIILPGSKNTIQDLAFLRQQGLDQAIVKQAEHCFVIGICGGLQMLGQSISDPLGIEQGGSISGLGLLDIKTQMAEEKTLKHVQAKYLDQELVQGYEIHHGQTTGQACVCMKSLEGRALGWQNGARLWGSYVHGLFDADSFRRFFLNQVRSHKNLPPLTDLTSYDLEPALDRLAQVVREHVEIDYIKKSMGL